MSFFFTVKSQFNFMKTEYPKYHDTRAKLPCPEHLTYFKSDDF